MIAAEDPGKKIQAWFSDVITASGRPQRDIAELLGLSPSAISKIKTGRQSLGAAELLILHEELGVPLPQLGAKRAQATPRNAAPVAAQTAAEAFQRDLFDRAYQEVAEIERMRPADKRMNQFEMLDAVFHVFKRILRDI